MKEQLKQLIQEVKANNPYADMFPAVSEIYLFGLSDLESKLDNFSPWISVEDGYPPDHKWVSVPYRHRRYKVWGEIPATRVDGNWLIAGNLGYDEEKITHYKELVQPPKSQKE